MVNIIKKLVPNYEKGRRGNTPKIAVWHTGEGNRNSIYSEFLNKEKSSHYCVNNDGTIWQFVELENTAWDAGIIIRPIAPILKEYPNLNPNFYSVGVENEGYANWEIDERQYDLNAQLALFFKKELAIPLERRYHLRHHEINADKTCPGKLNLDKILKLAIELEQKELQEEERKKAIMEKQKSLLEKLVVLLKELLQKVGINI